MRASASAPCNDAMLLAVFSLIYENFFFPQLSTSFLPFSLSFLLFLFDPGFVVVLVVVLLVVLVAAAVVVVILLPYFVRFFFSFSFSL